MPDDLMDARDLYRMVDEILHYVWDPIGVAGMARARDEYYAYVPATFKRVRDGETAETIAAYLDEIASVRMGLPPNPQRALKAAGLLIEWQEIVRASPSTLSTKLPPMPAHED